MLIGYTGATFSSRPGMPSFESESGRKKPPGRCIQPSKPTRQIRRYEECEASVAWPSRCCGRRLAVTGREKGLSSGSEEPKKAESWQAGGRCARGEEIEPPGPAACCGSRRTAHSPNLVRTGETASSRPRQQPPAVSCRAIAGQLLSEHHDAGRDCVFLLRALHHQVRGRIE